MFWSAEAFFNLILNFSVNYLISLIRLTLTDRKHFFKKSFSTDKTSLRISKTKIQKYRKNYH